eukprot:gene13963-19902_t
MRVDCVTQGQHEGGCVTQGQHEGGCVTQGQHEADVSHTGRMRVDVSHKGSMRVDVSHKGSMRVDVSHKGSMRVDVHRNRQHEDWATKCEDNDEESRFSDHRQATSCSADLATLRLGYMLPHLVLMSTSTSVARMPRGIRPLVAASAAQQMTQGTRQSLALNPLLLDTNRTPSSCTDAHGWRLSASSASRAYSTGSGDAHDVNKDLVDDLMKNGLSSEVGCMKCAGRGFATLYSYTPGSKWLMLQHQITTY